MFAKREQEQKTARPLRTGPVKQLLLVVLQRELQLVDGFVAGSHRIYDSQLQRLMDEDTRLANGEVGALDFDPLCQCQDYQKLEAHITVRSASPKAAVVSVNFRDLGMPNDKPRNAVLDLAKEAGHWRIHDIHAEDPKSLRAFLTEQNAERAHPPKGK